MTEQIVLRIRRQYDAEFTEDARKEFEDYAYAKAYKLFGDNSFEGVFKTAGDMSDPHNPFLVWEFRA